MVLIVAGWAASGAPPANAVAPPRVAPEVPVTAINLSNQLSQNSPALGVDPSDSRFVVAASRIDGPTDFGCELEVSGDGGRSWLPTQPVPTLPPGAEHCYAPEVAFDRSGRLYYLFVGLAGLGNSPMGVFLTSSIDRGRTFSRPRQVLGPSNYAVRMAIDPTIGVHGRIHLVWLVTTAAPGLAALPLSPNPILAAHSDDGGRTFSAPVQVSDPNRQLVVAPALALGADHAVHVAYYDLGDDRRDYQGLEGPPWEGDWTLVTASSRDGGRRFDTGVVANDRIVPPERVMLIFTMPPPALVAGAHGRVYVSWWDARNGDWDVLLARSADSGRSWSPPARLNDDALGNGRHQYMPRLSVATGGRVDAIFYDRRNDDQNLRNDVYYTFSTDGGRHFTANRRITSQSFYSVTGTRYPLPSAQGLVEFGSRIALVSGRSRVLAAWTDTRLVGRGLEHQDVFATEIDLAARAPGSCVAVLLGPGLAIAAVAVGLGLGLRALRRRHRRAPAPT